MSGENINIATSCDFLGTLNKNQNHTELITEACAQILLVPFDLQATQPFKFHTYVREKSSPSHETEEWEEKGNGKAGRREVTSSGWKA